MQIAVAFATEPEFGPWRRRRGFRPCANVRGNAYEAVVGGVSVTALVTGPGPERAARIVEMLSGRAPDVCVASGLAGGLKPEHRARQVLVARAVQRVGDLQSVRSDAGLVDLAQRLGAKAVDLFVTTPVGVFAARDKRRMGQLADAVDMESFAVMSAMARLGAAVVAVRAVVDTVDRDLPPGIVNLVSEDGSVRLHRVLNLVAASPRQVPALLRFGWESLRAASTLAFFLDE